MRVASNRRRRPGHAGVTSLEVAISFGVFVMLVFCVIDMSRYLFSRQGLSTLVAAVAREAYAGSNDLPPQCNGAPSPPTSWDRIGVYAPLLDPNQVGLCYNSQANIFTYPGATDLQILTVQATYNFTPITPLFDALIGQMTATNTYQF
jgi:hypothetical protein